jgi:hypothetical protein
MSSEGGNEDSDYFWEAEEHCKTLYEMVGVDIAKQNARSSARMSNIKDWTLYRGRPPLK